MDRRLVENVKEDFGKALKAARESNGKFPTAASFARYLGVESAAYAHWEAGRHLPDIPTMARICQLLRIEPNMLVPLAIMVDTSAEAKKGATAPETKSSQDAA